MKDTVIIFPGWKITNDYYKIRKQQYPFFIIRKTERKSNAESEGNLTNNLIFLHHSTRFIELNIVYQTKTFCRENNFLAALFWTPFYAVLHFLVVHYYTQFIVFSPRLKQKNVDTGFCLKRRAVNTLSIASGNVHFAEWITWEFDRREQLVLWMQCQDREVNSKNSF